MTSSVDTAFIKQFEREVHEAYQRMGSKLRNTVRSVNNVVGASTIFQNVGKGTAQGKTRNGAVPVMNVTHSTVECVLSDYYAGDWVDKLDLLKTNIDERQVVANAGAYALGRKTDDLIITQLATVASGQKVAASASGMTLAKVMSAFNLLGNADVPDDGERYAAVGPNQWSDLLQIEEFANSQWVGPDDLPFQSGGSGGKKWLGTTWLYHSGLPKVSTTRKTFWWHKSAIGFGSGSDVQTDITWHGDRASHFVNNMMSQGAILIDGAGAVEIDCTES